MESCVFPGVGSFESTVGFFCLLDNFGSLQGHRGIGASERALDIGISQLKLTCQHIDGKRSLLVMRSCKEISHAR